MPYPYNLETINARAAEDPQGFARECEAIFNRKVAETAAMIAERSGTSCVVFLSGPSGSGKTTTAKKLCDVLEALGVCAETVSIDKYYMPINPETAPRTEDGEIDLESPYCLDLELLEAHFEMLENGMEVIVPHFNFKKQSRDAAKAKTLKLEDGGIVIFEGIHALNDMLADRHPQATKLYISARSDVTLDGKAFFKRTWTRLLRRVVRDEMFRGTGASETLKMWATVRDGEKKYISPYKYKADLLFDSSMEYEIPILKKYALAAFRDIPEGTPRMGEIQDLTPRLEEFKDIDAEYVPADSILREFIGGGKFKY
jgi:uridine kinase